MSESDAAMWQLKYGQQRARCSVFMQAMAKLVRHGPSEREWAQAVIKAADKAAAGVKLDDFVTVKLS